MRQRVVDKTGVDLSAAQVGSRITGDADLNTVLLTATVTDSSPERSLGHGPSGRHRVRFDRQSGRPDRTRQRRPARDLRADAESHSGVAADDFNLAAGFALGLVAGVVIALLRSAAGHHDPAAAGAPDADRSAGARRHPVREVGEEVAADRRRASARSIRAEAFRQLRTNLQFIDVERPVRVLVVTSSVADEGKSTTATNLAVSFAESGRQVLLIEADLRRPRVADYLGLERAVGLTNVLAGQVDIEDVLQPWGRGGLSVLPSGSIPPNPSELLGSPRMLESARTTEDPVRDHRDRHPAAAAGHRRRGGRCARRRRRAGGPLRQGDPRPGRHRGAVAASRWTRGCSARILNMTPIKGSDGYESYGYGYYEEDPSKTVTLEQIDQSPVDGTLASPNR